MERRPPSPTLSTTQVSLLEELDAALGELNELPEMDAARFLETHQLYEGRSDQRRCIQRALCQWAEALPLQERRRRVLGVGCGDGEVDVPLARSLTARSQGLTYVGVDPNPEECAGMERQFAEADLEDVRLEVEVRTFEAFRPKQEFDLIHFVHSLYYMDDPARALLQARELLAPGGQLILLQAPREELNELAVRFYDKQYERPTLFAEDYTDLLETWGWDHVRTRVDARVDVTPLVEGESAAGEALRDFIIQIDGRRLPPLHQDLIDRYLRAAAFEQDGRSFISHPVDAFYLRA